MNSVKAKELSAPGVVEGLMEPVNKKQRTKPKQGTRQPLFDAEKWQQLKDSTSLNGATVAICTVRLEGCDFHRTIEERSDRPMANSFQEGMEIWLWTDYFFEMRPQNDLFDAEGVAVLTGIPPDWTPDQVMDCLSVSLKGDRKTSKGYFEPMQTSDELERWRIERESALNAAGSLVYLQPGQQPEARIVRAAPTRLAMKLLVITAKTLLKIPILLVGVILLRV